MRKQTLTVLLVSVLGKMESLQKEIVSCTTEVKTFETELTELKRTYQSLEIKWESVCAEVSNFSNFSASRRAVS